MRLAGFVFLLFFSQLVFAQQGALSGIVVDEKTAGLGGATVQLTPFSDSVKGRTISTAADGTFSFSSLPFGYFRLRITYVGLKPLLVDSLHFHQERYLISLGEIMLKSNESTGLDEIIIYAEKPLIQSKDGNITFNASESALSQGSNASDLLTQVPLVTKDPDGKVLVRGKEPRILIDDKPVELNMQQLQDLLESLPGSSIEKIEVMTNPPPQYANEQGGVINIVTRKGTVGFNGRLNLFAGTRGEAGANASFNYRKRGFSFSVNAGFANNEFWGNGYSSRQNIFADSTNFFSTKNNYRNQSYRPNLRASIDYEVTKFHLFNLVLQYNQNNFDNHSFTDFRNINRFGEAYRLSNRRIGSNGHSFNPNLNLNYTFKTTKPGEMLRLFSGFWSSDNASDRLFYQQYLQPDLTFTGVDSTQQQLNNTFSKGYHLRLAYDKPLGNQKTFLSFGSAYNNTVSDVVVDALFRRKTDGVMLPLDILSNNLVFLQDVFNVRFSVKQMLGTRFSATVGVTDERTAIYFDLRKEGKDTANSYWTLLPFFNLNKNWENNVSLTLSYRKSIRRPGINELNPTRDFSDPYNTRAGNPGLLPSTAHNFDLVLGRNKNAFFTNLSLGYNLVNDIFNPIRTLLPGGTTEIIWQNISGKKEYEISTWSGYTFAKKLRANLSASYIFNQYGSYDKQVRRYRDAGSFTSNLNTNYTVKDRYTFSGNFTYNRFANPQGVARSTMSMNVGIQARLLSKKLTLTLNMIDPIFQQQNRNFSYGPNFILENFNTTQTRNYRFGIGYNFSGSRTKRPAATEKAVQNLLNKG